MIRCCIGAGQNVTESNTLTDTKYRKTNLVLPPEVAEAFAFASHDDRNLELRNAYAKALHLAHWTLQSISEAAGVTRERVRQLVAVEYPDVDLTGYPVPSPPVFEKAAPREYVEPDPVKLARLLELKPLAQKVRSNSPEHRAEAEEYTRLIADVHLNDGVTLYRLALRLGVTHGALRFRLARYGYKSPASGTSKVYAPILEKNRA